MIISLIGYMGSGKSHISKILSEKLEFSLIDLDKEISQFYNLSIPEIFALHGELDFRKTERRLLSELLKSSKHSVLSVGGGTPCYYDNIELINEYSESFFLQASVPTLADRIRRQKGKRPILNHVPDSELEEFIAKHLFERNQYYAKAKHTITTTRLSPEEITAQIAAILENLHRPD